MIVYKKAKSYKEARRIVDFLRQTGFGAEVKKNQGFMSDKYSHQVVGNDEEAIGFIERHESIVNIATGKRKRKATWNRPKKFWNGDSKTVRS